MISLPFKLELNAPISKVLKNTQQPFKYENQLVFAINRLFKNHLRNVFISIKTSQLRSPVSYFKFILANVKQTKRQNRILYPTYNPQLPRAQSQAPKMPIFNNRVKSTKNYAFLKLKQFVVDAKSSQLWTLVNNRQNQLLSHLIPKIEQKIYAIVFRAIADYARQKKGKSKIIRLMDKLEKNMAKRVYYSELINKLKGINQRERKKKLGCQKLIKITKLSERLIVQESLRKIQCYYQSLKLEQSQRQKKQRLGQMQQMGSSRTMRIQKQRQGLRNLKYKLDQQSIQKNHIQTQKRRSLMLTKTKFTEQSKQMSQLLLLTSSQVQHLSTLLIKQSHIHSTLQHSKSLITQLSRQGIDFQSVTLTIYKAIYDMAEEGFEGFREIVKRHEQRWSHVQDMLRLQGVIKTREWVGRRVAMLEKVVRVFERKQGQPGMRQGQPGMNASRFKPLVSNASPSQLNLSPSASSLKGSRITNSQQYNQKPRILPDPSELTRLKQQYSSLQSFITLVLSKSYELKINQAIAAEIDQLSELLASDLKENTE